MEKKQLTKLDKRVYSRILAETIRSRPPLPGRLATLMDKPVRSIHRCVNRLIEAGYVFKAYERGPILPCRDLSSDLPIQLRVVIGDDTPPSFEQLMAAQAMDSKAS